MWCIAFKVVFIAFLFGVAAYLEKLRRQHRKGSDSYNWFADPLGISAAFFVVGIYAVYHLFFVPCP